MKKSTLHSILFIGAVTIAALAAHIVEKHAVRSAAPRISEEGGEKMFPSFAPEKAFSFTITAGKKTLRLEAREGAWILPDWDEALASRTAVITFLSGLAKTKPLREIRAADADALKELNLSTEPGLEPGLGAGISLKVADAAGKELVSMILGKAHIRTEQNLANDAGPTYDGRYVRVDTPDGEARVFLIGRVFETCLPEAPLWLEQLQIPQGDALAGVRYLRKETKNSQTTETPLWWVIPDAQKRSWTLLHPAGERFSLSELVRRIELLTNPFSRTLIPRADAEKIIFTDRMEMLFRNGVVYTLELAALPDGGTAGRLTPMLYPGRLPRAVGESDADYANRARQLDTRIQYEKRAFNGRVFQVKPELISILSKVPKETPPQQERKKP